MLALWRAAAHKCNMCYKYVYHSMCVHDMSICLHAYARAQGFLLDSVSCSSSCMRLPQALQAACAFFKLFKLHAPSSSSQALQAACACMCALHSSFNPSPRSQRAWHALACRYAHIINQLTWMTHAHNLRRVSEDYCIDLYLRPPNIGSFKLMVSAGTECSPSDSWSRCPFTEGGHSCG